MIRQHYRGTSVTSDAPGSFTAEPRSRPRGASLHGSSALWNTVVVGFVLCFEAALVGSNGVSHWVVAVVAAAAGMVGLFVHVPMLSRRLWFRLVLCCFVVLLSARAFLFPAEALEMGFVVLPRPVTIALAEFLFCWQVLILWCWQRSEPLPVAFPSLALVTSVLALNRSLSGDVQSLYVWLVTASLLLPVLLAPFAAKSSFMRWTAKPWPAKLVLMLVCGSILLGTWTVSKAWSRWLPDAQLWFATSVARTLGRTLDYRYRFRNYVRSGSLASIWLENTANPDAIAIRVYSDSQPGYLSGRVFDRYDDGLWRIDLSDRRLLQPLEFVPAGIADPPPGLSIFKKPGMTGPGPLRRMTIENDPQRGRMFFTPLGWRYFMGAGHSLFIDAHNTVRSGVSRKEPYVVIADVANRKDQVSDWRKRQLLQPLAGLGPRVAELARDVCRRSNTPQDKIRAVRAYFHDNYEYSLDRVEIPDGGDPLSHFLLTRHAAHCEFFASGVVALLRLEGIPARYVTGYRVLESSDDHWVARNRDAHAWAEAFDEQRQKWVIVEATPGFSDPTLDESSTLDGQTTGISDGGLAFAAENANALARWWYSLPAVTRVGAMSLFSFSAILAVFVYFRRIQTGRHTPDWNSVDPRGRHWYRALRRMDRRLKRHGLARRQSETLHQFADRVRSRADGEAPWLSSVADWYIDYASGRFQAADLSPPSLPSGGAILSRR